MRNFDWELIGSIVRIVIVIILMAIVLYFAGRHVQFCLDKTGQLDCTVVAVQGGK